MSCGVDVHKRFIIAVICDSSSANPKYIRKRFSTFNNQLIAFKNWLIDMTVKMYAWKVPESIMSLYTMHWKVLFPMSSLPILNGSELSKVRKMIIKMLNGLPISLSSVLSDLVISLLKIYAFLENFTRYQYKLINTRSSEKNRFQNALTVGNCKIDMVFSDVFGKSASSIINLILSNDTYTSEDILSKVHGRCKAS